MKKGIALTVVLGIIGVGCQNEQTSMEPKSEKMQPAQEEDNGRAKPRSQGGCCGAKDSKGSLDLENKTAEGTKIQTASDE